MALNYLYEQDYLTIGWPDDGGGGMGMSSWFDRDIADTALIVLYVIEPSFFVDAADTFYTGITPIFDVFPGLFVDNDVIYRMSGRSLDPVRGQMLRNEVRRVR